MNLTQQPKCFVTMPFGIKVSRASNKRYDFDRIWEAGILPAINEAGAQALRADVDVTAGFMHRAVLERLVQADIVLADVTTANPNVLYELGIRHALRPRGTIAIGDSSDFAPFDLALVRMIRYQSVDGTLTAESGQDFRRQLAAALRETLAGGGADDSPVFQLLGNPIPVRTSAAERRPLVFLSYAREDQTDAIKIYDALTGQDIEVWIDARSISPGEKWDLAIDTAIRKAEFIFILMSAQSVSKRSYLRKEIILALERAKEMLETDIFIVPVRLDECNVPRELSQHQWVDFFSDDSLSQLVRAIREGMKRRGG